MRITRNPLIWATAIVVLIIGFVVARSKSCEGNLEFEWNVPLLTYKCVQPTPLSKPPDPPRAKETPYYLSSSNTEPKRTVIGPPVKACREGPPNYTSANYNCSLLHNKDGTWTLEARVYDTQTSVTCV